MKTQILKTLLVGVVACCSTLTTYAKDDHLSISYLGNGQSFVDWLCQGYGLSGGAGCDRPRGFPHDR